MKDWRTIIKHILHRSGKSAARQEMNSGSLSTADGSLRASPDINPLPHVMKRAIRDEQKEQLAYTDAMGEKHPLSYTDEEGTRHLLTLMASRYEDSKSLCLRFVRHANGVREVLAPITINMEEMPPYMACVKDDPEDQWMLSIIKKSGLGVKIWGKTQEEPYGIVQFNEETLRKMNCEGMEQYRQEIESRYCGKIDCLDFSGWPIETRYYTDPEKMKEEKRVLEGPPCQPHVSLTYQPKEISTRIQAAETRYGTMKHGTVMKGRSISVDDVH